MYAYKWAEEVVSRFYKDHARASYTVLQHANITTGNLIRWLQNNDKRWVSWKAIITKLEAYPMFAKLSPTEQHYLQHLLSGFSENLKELDVIGPYKLLTEIIPGPILEKRPDERPKAARQGHSRGLDGEADRSGLLFEEDYTDVTRISQGVERD